MGSRMVNIWNRLKIILPQIIRFHNKNRKQRYGFAIVLIILTVILKDITYTYFGSPSIFVLLTAAVGLCSLYGGLGPGLFATFTLSVINFFFFLRRDVPLNSVNSDLILTGMFVFEGMLISAVNEARYQVEEQKDSFIGFTAHEIKNPLTTIKGYSELLLRNHLTYHLSQKSQSFIQEINQQTNRIIEIINDLLDITKIEIGKFSYNNSTFSLLELVKDTLKNQQILYPSRIIELRGKMKRTIRADKYRIRQVIVNLLVNSIKYSPPDKKIIITIRKKRRQALLSIKDFGVGIDKNDQNKIFEPYYRTRYAKKSRIEGTGLGLYISSQIVNQYKGKLWVESAKNRGSTFYLQLPIT